MDMMMPLGLELDGLRSGVLTVRLATTPMKSTPPRPCATPSSTKKWAPGPTSPPSPPAAIGTASIDVATHLVVIDETAIDLPGGVIATYRLIDHRRRHPRRRLLLGRRIRPRPPARQRQPPARTRPLLRPRRYRSAP
jgi:hypothetical protein